VSVRASQLALPYLLCLVPLYPIGPRPCRFVAASPEVLTISSVLTTHVGGGARAGSMDGVDTVGIRVGIGQSRLPL
jgi:hypothetical protein